LWRRNAGTTYGTDRINLPLEVRRSLLKPKAKAVGLFTSVASFPLPLCLPLFLSHELIRTNFFRLTPIQFPFLGLNRQLSIKACSWNYRTNRYTVYRNWDVICGASNCRLQRGTPDPNP
jgi:hypothetical protein